ncbi:MAG: superoxide dismutase [Xanthobacteraceae bacterium]|jgi:Fe-Mn family superoxide dismutase
MSYDLPPLRFAYHDLEPHLSEDLIRRHHQIHTRAYTEAINALLRDHPDLARLPIEDVLRSLSRIPEPLHQQIRTIGGGHANHQFQWKVIGPRGGKSPSGELAAAIDRDFGSFAGFRQRFVGACLDLVGSGWAFLCLNRPGGDTLEILTLPNNDSVLPRAKPGILICDLWEHAYCGQYDNRRGDYLDAFFEVIDWQVCNQRLLGMRAGRANL